MRSIPGATEHDVVAGVARTPGPNADEAPEALAPLLGRQKRGPAISQPIAPEDPPAHASLALVSGSATPIVTASPATPLVAPQSQPLGGR